MEPAPTKAQRTAAKQAALVAWLASNGGRQKLGVCRIDIPQQWQGMLNHLIDSGELIRKYKTGRSYTGRYKRCYIRLPPKEKTRRPVQTPSLTPSAMTPALITERLKFFDDPRFRFDPEPHEYYLGDKRLLNFSDWIKDYKEPFIPEEQAPRTAAKRGITVEQVLAEWERSRWVGTQVHAFIEAFYDTLGGPLPTPYPDAEVEKRCRKFLAIHAQRLAQLQPLGQEVKIFCEEIGMCGTLDHITWHPGAGAAFVPDWKTNSKFSTNQDRAYRMLRGPFADLADNDENVYSLQNSFYRVILERAGIETAGGAIVHLPPDPYPPKLYQALDFRQRLRTLLF